MGYAVETTKLTKKFGAVTAVRDLDLRIPTGEVFGFLGPNGSGKSTTIKILLDEVRATSGTAQLLGLDSHDDLVELHRRIGYLPGELRLPADLTGGEYLDFLAGLRSTSDEKHRRELLERFDLDPTRRLRHLSTGNKQKVGLVQAFMHRPELVLLDEPTTGLDPLVQHDFHEMLRAEAEQGMTVLLSSHALSEVDQVADQVGVIRRGALVAVERVDVLKAQARRQLNLEFAASVPRGVLESAPGVYSVEYAEKSATIRFEGDVDALLRTAVAVGHLVSVRTPEIDLEEVFLGFYRDAPPDLGQTP